MSALQLTLNREATKPAAPNALQQQAQFDDFITRYNTDRPHQALGMKVPADLYARSPRVYRGLEQLTYPFSGSQHHGHWLGPDLLPRTQDESQSGLRARAWG